MKVHNEFGKVTLFGSSLPFFSWRNGHLKKVHADSAPPALLVLKHVNLGIAYPKSATILDQMDP